jgi:hypothetical protein
VYTTPKTLPEDATVGDDRAFFENQPHRLLLVRRGACTGTINRTDIPALGCDEDAVGRFAQAPQTIHADASLADARRLEEIADHRLVVVDDQDRLQGLLCHNHAGRASVTTGRPAAVMGQTHQRKDSGK